MKHHEKSIKPGAFEGSILSTKQLRIFHTREMERSGKNSKKNMLSLHKSIPPMKMEVEYDITWEMEEWEWLRVLMILIWDLALTMYFPMLLLIMLQIYQAVSNNQNLLRLLVVTVFQSYFKEKQLEPRKKKTTTSTFHHTGCLIGILILEDFNHPITGSYPSAVMFFHCSLGIFLDLWKKIQL